MRPMLSITKKKSKSLNLNDTTVSRKRQPVLVYNSRVDSKMTDLGIEEFKTFSVSEDWKFFIEELNTKMFDKISF